MEKEVAIEIISLMLKHKSALEKSVKVVREGSNHSESERYSEAVSEIGVLITSDVLGPIFEEHPDLTALTENEIRT